MPAAGPRCSTDAAVLGALAAGLGPGRGRGGGPRRQGAHALAAPARGRHHRPGHGHRGGRLPAGSVRRPVPDQRSGGAVPRRDRRRRHRRQGTGAFAASTRRPTRPGGRRRPGRGRPRGRFAWPPCWPGCAPRWPTPWPRWGRTPSTPTSNSPWSGCWPAWRWSASRSTATCCGRSPPGWPTSAPRSRRPSRTWPATPFKVNSVPQLRTVLYEHLGLTPVRKTKTGFSTDARTLELLRGPAPDRRGAAALPRGGEAPLHLRGEPGRRGGPRRPDPRHLPPDGGPHRPAVVGPAQPAQHPGPDRGGPAVP